MSQVQIIGARLFGTIFLNGRILGPGYYAEKEDRLTEKDYRSLLEYEDRQKRLPPEKRDNPPLVKMDYIPLDESKTPGEAGGAGIPPGREFVPVDYTKKSIEELRELCRKREIQYGKKANAETLAKLLSDYDKELLDWTATFKDLNEFMGLSDEEKLAYLTEIFGLPEGMDEESEEAAKYSADLLHVVKLYAAQSQSDEVNAKLREIVEYYES